MRIALIPTAALLLGVLVAGCTSDLPNELGHELGNITVDTVLAPLTVEDLTQFSVLEVTDPEVPFLKSQSLYMGEQAGNASSILINFDFGNVYSEEFPDTLFTRENIKTVKFSLTMLDFYGNKRYIDDSGDSTAVSNVFYWISELDAPFDTTMVPPMAIPPHDIALFQDLEGDRGKFPQLTLGTDQFLDWVAGGDTVGFLLEAGPGSDPELMGYASQNLTFFSQIPPVAVGTVVGPNFAVEFLDGTFFLMPSVNDISTFHEMVEPSEDPTDEIMFRTGLRSYFALHFDLSELPANAYINRAGLRLTVDNSTSFGTLTTLQVAELDTAVFLDPATEMTTDELAAEVELTSALSSVDPYQSTLLEFNVTQYVQRRINEVYTGRRGLVISGDERVFGFNLGVAPDFYYNVFRFFGTAADDTLKPQMRITYTLVDEVTGGSP